MKKSIQYLVILIITTVALSTIVYSATKKDQTSNNQNTPTPTQSPTPTSTPSPTPTPDPSAPTFTLQFIDYSEDIPATYGTDPYTGERIIIEGGYHYDNKTIEVKIKNKLYSTDSSAYYGIRLKGHYGDEWHYAPDPYYRGYHVASDSDYTIVLITHEYKFGLSDVPEGGQVDIQVQTLIGNDKKITTYTFLGEGHIYEFTGVASGWSGTKTFTKP